MISNTHIYIEHNPFTLETKFIINEHEPAYNSGLSSLKKQPLQYWIDEFFDILYEEFNGQTDFKITFKGTAEDCEDMRLAIEEAKSSSNNMNIELLELIEIEGGESRLNKIKQLMEEAKESPIFAPYIKDNREVQENFSDAFNRDFDVYVVATMSSGKSTLINAMLGCPLLPALNKPTTATIASIIDNDSMQEGKFIAERIKKDKSKDEAIEFDFINKATEARAKISEWNEDQKTSEIKIEGNIVGIKERESVRLVLTDTPGPNNSKDEEHKITTMRHIKDSKRNPLILYVLNATQMGISDDSSLLRNISDIMKQQGKQNRDRFIFVVNKIDELDPEKENVENYIQEAKVYLKEHGIENPLVYPVSALLTNLLRINKLNENLLTTQESRQLSFIMELFTKNPEMDLVQYMPLTRQAKLALEEKNYSIALYRSGLPAVEAMIDDYINKYSLPHRVHRAYTALEEIIKNSINEAEINEQLELDEFELQELQENLYLLKEKQLQGYTAEGYVENLKNEERGLSIEVTKSFTEQETKIRKMFSQFSEYFLGSNKECSINQAKYLITTLQDKLKEKYTIMLLDLEKLIDDEQDKIRHDLTNSYKEHIKSLFDNIPDLDLPILEGIMLHISSFKFDNLNDVGRNYEATRVVEYKAGSEFVSTSTWYIPWTWGDGYYKDIIKTKEEKYVDLGKFWDEQGLVLHNFFTDLIISAETKIKENSNILIEQYIENFSYQFDKRFTSLLNEIEEKIKDSSKREEAIEEGKQTLKRIAEFKNKLDQVLAL